MERMKNWLLEEESGQGMVEYGLIIVLIAVVVIGALTLIGRNLDTQFNDIARNLDGAPASS